MGIGVSLVWGMCGRCVVCVAVSCGCKGVCG